MRALMFNRPDIYTHLGGDCVQTLKTCEGLKNLGVDVVIATDFTDIEGVFDIVHLFNITRPKATLMAARHLKKLKAPIVLSPIYWNTDELIAKTSGIMDGGKKRLGKRIELYVRKNIVQKYSGKRRHNSLREMQEEILSSVDMILPNSKMEEQLVEKDFFSVPSCVVPNAVERCFFDGVDPATFLESTRLEKGYVLCAARFDERKNQLKIIERASGAPYRIVFAGMSDEKERSGYENACLKAANDNVSFLPRLNHHELACAYLGAAVHVLPSWYETPGLSSLEAGLAGCRVVVSDRGSTREYFEDHAWYCDPDNPDTIREAMDAAYESSASDALKKRILENYTWEHAAEATLKAYKMALGNK